MRVPHRIGNGSVLYSKNSDKVSQLAHGTFMLTTRNVRGVSPPTECNAGQELERFVDALVAAKFLSITPRQLLELARKGSIPAYPLGEGKRRVWRFRLSALADAMEDRMVRRRGEGTVVVSKARSMR